MGNAATGLCDGLNAAPYLAALGDEVVMWIDDKQGRDHLFICNC